MQKQTYGHRRRIYSTSIRMVISMQDLSKLSSQNIISPIRSNNKVIMLLLTSKPVKDIKSKPQKLLFYPKTFIFKLFIIESNISNTIDFFVKE